MKFVKKFERFIKESSIVASPKQAPVKPGIDVPTKPKRPTQPENPDKIETPSVNPDPKAEKEVTEMDVVKRFRDELEETGESVEKYINK